MGLGTSAGIRPGSGRKPPGSARLRTGVAPSGPGTQAAQGFALSASVNVSDRPVTGQGVMGMKVQSANTGRIVTDAAYFVGLLRKKINDVNIESNKLKTEIEQQSKDNSQYVQLERKYETLSKSKEALEGQLADYNLALDKTRTSTDPEDVQQMAIHMAEKNRQTGQELDRIFMQRKQRESETQQIEEQIEGQYRLIQKKIKELEPGKLRAYNDLLAKQRELQDRTMQSESRLNELNGRIRQYESDEKSNSLRKEYLNLEKSYQTLKKDTDSLHEELEIANLDPKEAHTKFVARVNDFKQRTKLYEDKVAKLKEEIVAGKKNLEELNNMGSGLSGDGNDDNEQAKYELLVKRDQDMTAFMESFPETRNGILEEQQSVQFVIVALLEHIGKGMEDSANMPSTEAHLEMESAKTFKQKNLVTAQRTMESLHAEKKKREKELDMLRSSEPKLMSEIFNLRQSMSKMREEMELFKDLDGLRRGFDATQVKLSELKQTYIKRKETMRQQIQSVSLEHETLKKNLNANDVARELDETEKRLKHYERSIFELKDFVDVKSRETDYDAVKASCVRLVDVMNSVCLKTCNSSFGSQAKGGW